MSLAVKYRPTTFDAVIGQNHVTSSIKHALKRATVPHSWLFLGGAGQGKTTCARLLAAHFAGGTLGPANLIEINAASNTGIDDMRAVISQAHYKAIGASPTKTIIIDEAHRLSGNAWDSLLKPIEEPLAHVYWVLCSTNPGKIPETIKTRCVTYVFKPVSEELICDLLVDVSEKEGLKVSDEVLEVVAENSQGSPRQALTNLELCAGAKSASEARQLMQTALQTKGPIDLARLLLQRTKPSWSQIVKLLASIDADAETVRIVLMNYVSGALMKAKSEQEVKHLLFVLDCFSQPYQQSDKLAPLLLSIGVALGLNQ